MTSHTNGEQLARWNGIAGQAWAEEQEMLDRMFQPFADLLAETVSTGPTRVRVLDVGCGTGATTLAIARRLPGTGHCTGIDISGPMLAVAQTRAAQEGVPASFLRADAQTHPFEHASFDWIVSRFGVMFFDNPVQAFANLHQAARLDARMRLITWRASAENPFMTAAERAAAPLLPSLPPRQPDAPGQFALADPSRIRGTLEQSGWTQIELDPIDIECSFPEQDLVSYFTKLGPLGLILPEVGESTRGRVIETVRAAFEPYVHGGEVRFNASCWMVSARSMSISRRR